MPTRRTHGIVPSASRARRRPTRRSHSIAPSAYRARIAPCAYYDDADGISFRSTPIRRSPVGPLPKAGVDCSHVVFRARLHATEAWVFRGFIVQNLGGGKLFYTFVKGSQPNLLILCSN